MLNSNVLIDLISLFVIACIWMIGMRKRRLRTEFWRLYYALVFVIMLVFIVDIPSWLINGKSFGGAKTLLIITNTLYYILQTVYCYLWILFADCWALRQGVYGNNRAIWYTIPMIVEIIIVILNISTGWIFYIDAGNIYHRGAYYMLNSTPFYLYIIGSLAITLYGFRGADAIQQKRTASMLVFMFLPVCGGLLQTFTFGVSWVWPFAALSLLIVYLDVQQQAMSEERIGNARREQEAKVEIMLSEIQPHFLYNSLTTIYCLCETDPMKAQQAVGMFSNYLRFNMDALKREKPIPFSMELSHVRVYTSLEEMRFENMLNVVWDIQAENFTIPSLTLQPLVENAVKHGVGRAAAGGTVTISSREESDCFVVIVADDGVGFDPNEPMSGGRSHIGLDNVRSRLESKNCGTLEVVSEKGVGTTVTIKIPKDEQK